MKQQTRATLNTMGLLAHSPRLAWSAMQRQGGKKRRQRDDEEKDRPRKRGKDEADEDDDIFGYGATDPAHGEKWTEEQDLRLIQLRTYVHPSGLRLSWTHVAERFPNRSKQAVKHRWREIASEQLQKAHALTVHGEHKAWDEAQEEQLRELKRQGVTNQDIASRMGRSAASVNSRWSTIADEGEKQKHVPFSKVEDKLLLRLAAKRPRWSWRRIARRFPGRSEGSVRHRLRRLQHSVGKRVGTWTRREQVPVKSYVAAGAKPMLIAKRLGTRTPGQVMTFIRDNDLSMTKPWRAQEDEWLRAAVAAAKRLRIDEQGDEASWSVATWRWVAVYVGRGWLDCLARADVLRPRTTAHDSWTHAELVELACVMLLPRGDRDADYHVAFGRTKQQCTNKWHNLKHDNPTLLASVVAEATASGSSSSASSSSAASMSAASARAWRALASLTRRQRLIYELARRSKRNCE